MTTYTSPLDSQNQTYVSPDAVNGWQLPFPEQREIGQLPFPEQREIGQLPFPEQKADQQQPFPEQRENWQIVPPIITEGRIAAVNAHRATPPSQEVTTLFQVSFTGLDQQHYTVSATVKPPPSGVLVERGHVMPSEPMLNMPSTAVLAQPLLHPVWQGTVSPAESVRELSPLAVRTASNPSATQEATVVQDATLGRPNINNSEHVSGSPAEQADKEDTAKNFLLQIIQPGLVGLMDGSVSTLAPIFAVAFATHQPFTTFLVGMASALGAGISMAFSEALSDDGDLTGRGNPFIRGGVTGLMTFLSGAGHALPFLIPHLQLALFVAYAVVVVELLGIAAIRHKFFGTKWWLSIVQVVGGGALVFVAALLLGSA
jgi:hypothetical protein